MKQFLLLIFLSGWYILPAQDIKINGKVTGENNEILKGANVELLETHQQQITGQNGEFVFAVKPGKYTLAVSYTGYKPKKTVVIAQRDTYLLIKLQPAIEQLGEVLINAVKATSGMPVAQTNLSKKTIVVQNVGQDVPYLLETLPSVVVTSDAGAGIGYTGIRIRGISSQQINVTLNGIPFNDPESQSVYWVDIPDIAANTESIQIQRGVATSSFGTGAFGAALNLQTDKISPKAYATVQAGYGSFNTKKYGVKGSTGLLNKHFEFSGHFSKTTSDGYIDRASSDLKSYYVSGAYKDQKNTLKAIIFGGHERTYQAWYGLDKATFETNPTFNYAGAIYDSNWNVIDYYDNQVDDYRQDHYQLHYSHRFSQDLKLHLAAHYTYGRGYYEEYEQDKSLSKYGLSSFTANGEIIEQTDIIQRKWLDNDFYGLAASLSYKTETAQYTFGLAANEYDGRHFGRIIWAKNAFNSAYDHEYYRNTGLKKSVNGFAKALYQISPKLKLFTDVQFRRIDYQVTGTKGWQIPIEISDNFFFINPKLGLSYNLNLQNDLYISIAQTHREPNRSDYKYATGSKPEAETLNDIEAGWKYRNDKLKTEVNLYGMFYENQLVLTGKITNTGDPIKANVGKSHRIGVELQTAYQAANKWQLQANLTLSDNRNDEYAGFKNTQIAYSPSLIGAGIISFKPVKSFNIQAITKYVSEQYMDNRNIAASKLDAYWTENIFMSYQLSGQSFKNLNLSLKLNNIFNKKYASNGYMWGDTPYYFPQAGFNVLGGVTITF